jgi:2,4-dienoyl-CoA reductase-like NADH-dependent reductase (Old Yellow Enzyme family)
LNATSLGGADLFITYPPDLLASFLSPKSNKRTDQYSCDTPVNALRLIHHIVTSIRASCPPDFVIGIKLNAADYVSGGAGAEERALSHLRHLASWQMIDFVEISGGDYEDPGACACVAPGSTSGMKRLIDE